MFQVKSLKNRWVKTDLIKVPPIIDHFLLNLIIFVVSNYIICQLEACGKVIFHLGL